VPNTDTTVCTTEIQNPGEMSCARVQGEEDHGLLELTSEIEEGDREVCPSYKSRILVCASLLTFKAIEKKLWIEYWLDQQDELG